MRIGRSLFLSRKKVALGEGSVTQFILFENKNWFSLILNLFNTVHQGERAHSHAFWAWSILLTGWYTEKVYEGTTHRLNTVNRHWPRFLPRNYTHEIGQSRPGTWTLLLTGPWEPTWWEYFASTKTWVRYGWGRQVRGKQTETPEELR